MYDISISQAERHWKKYQPTRYKRLKAEGTLKEELHAAAKLTAQAMELLTSTGMPKDQAFMEVRGQYLFPPEESELTAKDEEQIDSRLYELMVEKNRLLDQMAPDDD